MGYLSDLLGQLKFTSPSAAKPSTIAAGGGGLSLNGGALTSRCHPATHGIMSALRRGYSTAMQATGDSTGDNPDEWFGLLGTLLGAKFPNHSVHWRYWNDTNQAPDRGPAVLQAGTSGTRWADVRSGAGFYLDGPNITGDIELIANIKPDDWASGSLQTVISKWGSTANQRSVQLTLDAAGTLSFSWSTDGTSGTANTKTSTVAVPFTTGQSGWVRVQHDVDNGASGNNTLFFTSTDGVTFTQLGTTLTTSGVTSHFAGNLPWYLGARIVSVAQDFLTGAFNEVWIQSGLSVAAVHQMPTLPEFWELLVPGGTYLTLTGSPVIQMWSASQSGQNVPYLDNSTRRPKLFPNVGQRLLIVNTAMNDSGQWQVFTTGSYQTFLTNVRTLLPGVPFICLGQNPIQVSGAGGSFITEQGHVDHRYLRNASLLQWAASGAVPGTYAMDKFPAWAQPFNPALFSDGYLHPSHGVTGGGGAMVEARYLFGQLFGLAP